MKSPCYDCRLLDEDKNGDECRLCEARAIYAEGVETGYRLKVVRLKKKKEGIMAKRGACGNCGREKMLLPAFGYCWICYEAQRDAEKAGESAAEALGEIKERVKSGEGLRGKLKKGKKAEGERREAEGKRQAEGERHEAEVSGLSAHASCLVPNPEPSGMIYLEFKGDQDQGLFEWLVDYAAEFRRSVDQQILWILQQYVEVSKEEEAGKQKMEDGR